MSSRVPYLYPIDTSDQLILCCGGLSCSSSCMMFSSTHDLQTLDASIVFLTVILTIRNVSRHWQMSWKQNHPWLNNSDIYLIQNTKAASLYSLQTKTQFVKTLATSPYEGHNLPENVSTLTT